MTLEVMIYVLSPRNLTSFCRECNSGLSLGLPTGRPSTSTAFRLACTRRKYPSFTCGNSSYIFKYGSWVPTLSYWFFSFELLWCGISSLPTTRSSSCMKSGSYPSKSWSRSCEMSQVELDVSEDESWYLESISSSKFVIHRFQLPVCCLRLVRLCTVLHEMEIL